ncbi:hypothetical protein AB6A40_002535 [Gnathostoma spinigerum]|uniref:Uncharacterized protein n=1 Tax=Gnathostoma spinigerum TaxID=75299 RepID=A0ABD6E9E8_9BILA
MTDYLRAVARTRAQFTRSGDVTLSNETFTSAVPKSARTTISLKSKQQKKPVLSQEAERLAKKAAQLGGTKCAEAAREGGSYVGNFSMMRKGYGGNEFLKWKKL